jgi:PAS domain S-box-containing protein
MGKKQTYEELEQRIKELEKEAGARRQVEDALRQSEKRYRELADLLPQVVFETDKTGKVNFANRNAFDLFGYSQDDFDRGVTAIEMLIPEDRNRAMENIQQMMRGEGSGGNEFTALRKDGSTFPVSIHANALIRENKPMGMRGIIIDLSQRKEAAEALRQSEVRYRSLVENTMDGYFVCEIPSGRFRFLNQRSCDLYGYTMKEGLELTVWDIISPEDHGRIRDRIQARLEYKDLSSELQTYTAVRKDGYTLRVEISTSLVTFQGIPGVQGIIRDVTEHERLEQQLQQAQKMEAIGTLAAGIAHDFNNLLMCIQGRASLMLMKKGSSHADFKHLRGIEDYVKSAADLTRQLLGFARGGKYEVKPTDLQGLLTQSSKMFSRTKKEITIRSKYRDDLWAIEADPGQIEQVLLNLYVNAWHAMPGGGELCLETENMVIDEHYSKPYHVEPGKYVKLSITDTGSGMDEATRKRIFDPFFTTREMGRGTGLGLASVYGIIKNHGGFVDVYSEKDHGTTFKIFLPATKATSMAQRAGPDKGLEMARGTGKILLVDDEDMIIEVGTELLQEIGYHVLIARNGREAIEIVSETHPDLVILGMIMPDMGGGETYDRLNEISPGIRVLLSSGYSIDGQATEILKRGCNGFIQKPFNIEELSQKLREILELTTDY